MFGLLKAVSKEESIKLAYGVDFTQDLELTFGNQASPTPALLHETCQTVERLKETKILGIWPMTIRRVVTYSGRLKALTH